jgi:hypothetical protein
MTDRPDFWQRPLYQESLSLAARRARAVQRRAAGWYNLATLWDFRCCWLLSGSLADFIAYLRFRRDLGYPLTALQRKRLTAFDTLLNRFWLRLTAPALWRCRINLARRQTPASAIEAFAHFVKQAPAIQLVGNSATLTGKGLGAAIDAAPLVLRFNRCFAALPVTTNSDSGSKTDIWVCAPDYKQPGPGASWQVISGPDWQGWSDFLPGQLDKSSQVVSVPIWYWRQLVQHLAAPPSAGLLMSFWLRHIAPDCRQYLVGFGFDGALGAQYHVHDIDHVPSSRHHWPAEKALLARWQQQQLLFFGSYYA